MTVTATLKGNCAQELERGMWCFPKRLPVPEQISTTQLVNRIKAPLSVPLRVDFAGGWLDVPRHARQGAYIVNCAISPFAYPWTTGPMNSGPDWEAAEPGPCSRARDPVQSELALGVGSQDPAVIAETGLCVWRSGAVPVLDIKSTGDFLAGKMAVFHTGHDHDTPGMADGCRDYARIAQSSLIARAGVMERSIHELAAGVALYHSVQLQEGMAPLPALGEELAKKYLGGGFGGYALYLFASQEDRDGAVRLHDGMRAVEPYCKSPF